MGARFAKWRDVFQVTDALPRSACVSANASALARYAGLCHSRQSSRLKLSSTGRKRSRVALRGLRRHVPAVVQDPALDVRSTTAPV
jgi:Fructose-bisphosphate aldolase class-I